MCHACVIETVKKQMLAQGRHSQAEVDAQVAQAPAALRSGHEMVVDMTHVLNEDFPTFFGQQELFRQARYQFEEHGFNLSELRLHEHIGTHVDAPLHFSADGQSIAEIPVGNLVVPLCVVDIRERAAANADAQLTPEDIQAWEAKHGPLPPQACVAMMSGWDKLAATERFRNADEAGVMHFPGVHPDAVQYLMENTQAVGMAVDTLSLDYGASADFAAHRMWLPSGRWGLEAITNLEQVPASGATLVVAVSKIEGCSGGLARVMTLA